MAQEMAKFSLPASVEKALGEALVEGWDAIKTVLAPHVWEWFQNNKDVRIGRVFGMWPLYWGSFDLVKGAITAIFGDDPSVP